MCDNFEILEKYKKPITYYNKVFGFISFNKLHYNGEGGIQ